MVDLRVTGNGMRGWFGRSVKGLDDVMGKGCEMYGEIWLRFVGILWF